MWGCARPPRLVSEGAELFCYSSVHPLLTQPGCPDESPLTELQIPEPDAMGPQRLMQEPWSQVSADPWREGLKGRD